MPNCAENTHLSPDQRLAEMATILATGILRLRQRAALPTERNPEISEITLPEGLDLSDETRLSVLVG
jgi:hypothetical protein